MTIDAHQHFWAPSEVSYPWLTDDLAPINRHFGPEHLEPLLRASGVVATVLVQSADSRADTEAMLSAAARCPWVVGVVAWVPIENATATFDRLVELHRNPVVVGVRTLIHDNPDPDHVLQPQVLEGLRVLAAADVSFDLVTSQLRHLEHVPTLAEAVPGLRIVLDHLGAPPFGQGETTWQRWEQLLARAALDPSVTTKASGLYPAVTDQLKAPADEARRAFDHAMNTFGSDRIMFGSDWPISVLSGGYGATWALTQDLLAHTSPLERHDVLSGTAAKTYRLDQLRLTAAGEALGSVQ